MARKRLIGYLSLVIGMAFTFLVIAYQHSAEAQGASAPPGSYASTCSNIQLTSGSGNTPAILSATCTTRNNTSQQTSLVYDIANCNGNLAWAPNGC